MKWKWNQTKLSQDLIPIAIDSVRATRQRQRRDKSFLLPLLRKDRKTEKHAQGNNRSGSIGSGSKITSKYNKNQQARITEVKQQKKSEKRGQSKI
jgi:hypothetical protein